MNVGKLILMLLMAVMVFYNDISMVAQDKTFGSMNWMVERYLKHDVPEISSQSLAFNFNEYILVDTREEPEYKVSHLKGALFMGYNNANWDILKQVKKEDKIVVYCSVGVRSENITRMLLEKGYLNVYNLKGGLFYWANQNKTLIQMNHTTKSVHPYSWLWGQLLENHITKTYIPE